MSRRRFFSTFIDWYKVCDKLLKKLHFSSKIILKKLHLMESEMFRRKAIDKLKDWKDNFAPQYAVLLEGARRVGKSTIAEEFAKENYRSYIKIDFANITNELSEVFKDIANLERFFLRLQTVTGITLYKRESAIIFDEIQLNPSVRQAIKYLVHDGRYDYIETGSLISIKKKCKKHRDSVRRT